MTKQMEIQQHNAVEQKKMSQSLTVEGESRQKEVRSFHFAVKGSVKIFYQIFVTFSPEIRPSCDEDQPAQRGARGAEGEGRCSKCGDFHVSQVCTFLFSPLK